MTAKILVIDDEEVVRKNITEMLILKGFACECAKDAIEALKRLENESFDVVVADIRMPDMDGLMLTKKIKARGHPANVIIMTGFSQEYSYVEVIDAGAKDFITKPFATDTLVAKIRGCLKERQLIADLIYHSSHDSLTGLLNRRGFFQKLEEEIGRAKRQKHNLSLIILDVDHFKACNDTYGHLQGDRILAALGKILTSAVRYNVDSACRFGGDEFTILLIETDLSQACKIAERIRRTFNNKRFGNCTLSIGVAQLSPKEEIQDIIRRADKALYIAKEAGGNRVENLLNFE